MTAIDRQATRAIAFRGPAVALAGGIVAAALAIAIVPPAGKVAALSLLAVCVVPVALYAKDRQLDLFNPGILFPLFFVAGYGLKGALVVLDRDRYFTFPDYPVADRPGTVLALAGLGLVGFYVGYFSPIYVALRRVLPDLDRQVITQRRLQVGSLAGLTIGAVSLTLLLLVSGVNPTAVVLQPFSADVRAAMLGAVYGRGHLLVPVTLMPVFTTGYLIAVLGRRKRPLDWVGLVAALLGAVLALALVGSRLYLLSIVIAAAVVYHHRVRRVSFSRQMVVMSVMATLGALFGIMMFAGMGYSATSPADMVQRVAGTFDSYDNLELVLANSGPPFWGQTVVEDVLVTYVPRSVVPAKPTYYGMLRIQERILPGIAGDQTEATYPPSIVAEGYANGGLAGVFLLPALLGGALRLLYERCRSGGAMALLLLAVVLSQILTPLRGFGPFAAALVLFHLATWLTYVAKPGRFLLGQLSTPRRETHV